MSRRSMRKIGIVSLGMGALVLLVWAGIVAYAAGDLVTQLRAAKALASGGVANVDAVGVTTVLQRTRRDVVTLRRQAGWLVVPAAHLRWLPGVGPLLGAGPELLEVGDALTDLGGVLWADVSPTLVRYQRGESWQGLLPELLSAIGHDLERKQVLVNRAQSAYAGLDVAALPSGVQGYADMLGQGLSLLADGLEVAGVAPALLGFDGPRTYLVLALNEDELRPGGGFITGVGEVKVAAGDVVSMVFRDSYAVDDFSLPYPDPPEPLRQFMGLDLWAFRDSNWSPDFPTAARQAIALYRPGTPVDVDGVVAIDQRAVQILLGGLGGLQVAGLDEPVTSDTVITYMRGAWAPDDGTLDREWWAQRKHFMGDLAVAAMVRLRSGQVDLSALWEVMAVALDERHAQVYLEDSRASVVLARRGWDGSLSVPEGDVLALVEANVGYNKVSTNIARRLTYQIDLRNAVPQASLTVLFTHLAQHEQRCIPEIRYDADYAFMMQRCYWGHFRLFLRPGVALVDATKSPIAAESLITGQTWTGDVETSTELGQVVFAQALLLPAAAERELHLTYLLPPEVVSRDADGAYVYRLTIRKQAGLAELAGRVSLLLPENAIVLNNPADYEFGGGAISWQFQSSTDVIFVVRYTVPEAIH